MNSGRIKLLSTRFRRHDGFARQRAGSGRDCVELIRDLQHAGAVWAINTGRSVDLLESGLTDFEFPIRPDFILTTEREVFRPGTNGDKWEAFGDWNARCARDHAELFSSAQSTLAEVVDFVTQKTKAQLLYHTEGLEGLRAANEQEMDRIVEFIEQAREPESKFHYQRNTVYPAILSRRLSQRRGAGRAGAITQHSARKHFRRRRSSQRHLNVEWRSRRDAGVSGECNRRSESRSACCRGLRREAESRRRRARSAQTFHSILIRRFRRSTRASPEPDSAICEGIRALKSTAIAFCQANASRASASTFPANRFVM